MFDKLNSLYHQFLRYIKFYWNKISCLRNINMQFCIKRCMLFFQAYQRTIIKFSIPFLIIIILLYSCLSARRVVNHNLTTIFELANNIRLYYSNKPDYWGLSTNVLINNDVIPSQYVEHNVIRLENGVRILFGEGYSAEPVSPRALTFDIIMPNLNKAQCLSYAEALLSGQQLLVLDKLTIYNDLGTFPFTWGGENSLPIKKYSSKNYCMKGSNTIIWSLK